MKRVGRDMPSDITLASQIAAVLTCLIFQIYCGFYSFNKYNPLKQYHTVTMFSNMCVVSFSGNPYGTGRTLLTAGVELIFFMWCRSCHFKDHIDNTLKLSLWVNCILSLMDFLFVPHILKGDALFVIFLHVLHVYFTYWFVYLLMIFTHKLFFIP